MKSLDRWLALAASVIGGVSLIGGVGYGLDAAWGAGLIGPAHAVTAALLLGTLALIVGDRLWTDRWKTTAAGLSGGGMGVLYLALFTSYDHFGWLSAAVASVLLLAVTAVGAVQAVRRDSQLMACLGLAGGLVTPVLMGSLAAETAPYQLLVALLDAAVVFALVRRKWPVLAWLAVICTSLAWATGAWWGTAVMPVVIGAALVGSLFAWGATRPLDDRLTIPLFAGVLAALVTALGTLTREPVLAMGTVSTLLAMTRIAAARKGWKQLSWCASVGAAAILAIAGLYGVLGGIALSPALTIAVFGAPAAIMWATIASSKDSDHGEVLPLGLAAAVVGTATVMHSGRTDLLPFLGGLFAMGGLFASTTWRDGRIVTHHEHVVVAPIGLLGAAAALAFATGPFALPAALLLVAAALLTPALLTPESTPARWAPLAAAPFAFAALCNIWYGMAPGLGGLPPLAAGLLALGGLRWSASDDAARRVYLSLCIGLAVLAVPMQLQREAWTIGWALLAAGLAWAGRDHLDLRGGAGWTALALVAAVTIRLVANPAVLTYHLADGTPVLWVLYGYGLPLAALVAVERWQSQGRPWVQAAIAGVAFAGLNLVISQLFSSGGSLELIDITLHARVARTIGWSAAGLGMLGLSRHWKIHRHLGVALLTAVVVKVVASDLWVLDGLSRAALLGGIAACFLAAAGLLQRAQGPQEAAA